MPKLRRRRVLLLALLMLVLVAGVLAWWAATTKSDFEKQYDRLELGMTYVEVRTVMRADQLQCVFSGGIIVGTRSYSRMAWADDEGERVAIVLDGGRVAVKEFTPIPMIERARSYWLRVFRKMPPF
jgi:hypothetical protein